MTRTNCPQGGVDKKRLNRGYPWPREQRRKKEEKGR